MPNAINGDYSPVAEAEHILAAHNAREAAPADAALALA